MKPMPKFTVYEPPPDLDGVTFEVKIDYKNRDIEHVIPPPRVGTTFITTRYFEEKAMPIKGILRTTVTTRRFTKGFDQGDDPAELLRENEVHAPVRVVGELKNQHSQVCKVSMASLGSPARILTRRGCEPDLVYPYIRRGFKGDFDISLSGFDTRCYYAVMPMQVPDTL